MRNLRKTSSFKKDAKLLKKRGEDMAKLDRVVLLIAMEDPLPPSYGAHPLHGNWEGCMDCHIDGDWVLIYELHDDANPKQVTFHRTGTHSDLF